jgi:hypothetical protein
MSWPFWRNNNNSNNNRNNSRRRDDNENNRRRFSYLLLTVVLWRGDCNNSADKTTRHYNMQYSRERILSEWCEFCPRTKWNQSNGSITRPSVVRTAYSGGQRSFINNASLSIVHVWHLASQIWTKSPMSKDGWYTHAANFIFSSHHFAWIHTPTTGSYPMIF